MDLNIEQITVNRRPSCLHAKEKKMPRGRPRLPGNEGRVCVLHVRLTAEESERLGCWANIFATTVSDLARDGLASFIGLATEPSEPSNGKNSDAYTARDATQETPR